MMRIEYPQEVYADAIFSLSNLTDSMHPIKTTIQGNLIHNNMNIQVVTFKALMYKASLLEFDCSVRNATLEISNNNITRNQFIGIDSTFFYINGGIANVTNNDIGYNGMLTGKMSVNVVGRDKRQYDQSHFPWESYSFSESQDHGIFAFSFDTYEMP